MNDSILKPLDPIYGKKCGRRDANLRIRKIAKYNRERERRIAKCWDCEYFVRLGTCTDPTNCRKEKHE